MSTVNPRRICRWNGQPSFRVAEVLRRIPVPPRLPYAGLQSVRDLSARGPQCAIRLGVPRDQSECPFGCESANRDRLVPLAAPCCPWRAALPGLPCPRSMDPLAHTLMGTTLAATRLRDSTPLAVPALVLGANAPDIDAVTMLVDRDLSLWFRRGWTHGVLAMVVLPIALTLLLLAFDRVAARVRGKRPAARAGRLLGLSMLAVVSHPSLDWMNTYGVRFLMPFDGTWFYGDALFIVDPWIWLLLGASTVLAFSASRGSAAAWSVLGVATTVLVLAFASAPVAVRWAWCCGVAAIVWLRLAGSWRRETPRLASICLASAITYVALMVGLSEYAVRQVAGWLAQRGIVAEEIMAIPRASAYRATAFVGTF